jgi:hypothetical protein
MNKEKILTAENGKLYYPFSEDTVWIFDPKNDKWNPIPRPDFLISVEGELFELVMDDDCSCSSRDLFNFGCRC